MDCPTDQTTLVMTERSGVEIDYCPQCRGVWLDRGELDKIIERNAQLESGRAPADDRPDDRPREERVERHGDHRDRYRDDRHRSDDDRDRHRSDDDRDRHRSDDDRDRYRSRDDRYRDDRSYKKRKKESFLGDLFDF